MKFILLLTVSGNDIRKGVEMGIKKDKAIDIVDIGVINNESKLYKKTIKKCFFIDYENVKDSGLRGIAKLDKHDAVIIFYSDRAFKIPLDIANVFSESRAKLVLIKVDVGTKNALDFQLVSYLGYVISKHIELGVDSKYFMVTNDSGFDCVKYFWVRRGVKIHRVSQIERDPEIIDDKQSVNVDKGQEQTQVEQTGAKDKEIEGLKEKVRNLEVALGVLNGGNVNLNVGTVGDSVNDIKSNSDTANINELRAKIKSIVLRSKEEKILNRAGAITNIIVACTSKEELNVKLHQTFNRKVGSQRIDAFYREIRAYLPY